MREEQGEKKQFRMMHTSHIWFLHYTAGQYAGRRKMGTGWNREKQTRVKRAGLDPEMGCKQRWKPDGGVIDLSNWTKI